MTDLAVRTAYDAVAVSYADLFRSALAASPFDRAVLGIFAELVSGRMAHVGCGPGRITGHLHQLGADVFGVDLSPQMVAVARTDHPRLRLDVGTITQLHLEQGYGHDISLDVYRMDPARVTAELDAAGLDVCARLVRDPVGREQTPQAYLLATRQ